MNDDGQKKHKHELRRATRRFWTRLTTSPKAGTTNRPQRNTYFHVGTEGMQRDGDFDRIQEMKERRRARRAKGA